MLVADAGVVVAALVQADALGEHARGLLLDDVAAPELLDLEVGSVLRRLVLSGQLGVRRASGALTDLGDLPVRRVSHRPLLARCWDLRHAVSFYDGAYVALAEALGAPLATTDARLARAVGSRCHVELLR